MDDDDNELADDNDDKYYKWALVIQMELQDTPANNVGRWLFEAYKEWVGKICMANQLKLMELSKDIQEASNNHVRVFGGSQ
jgi:hypothetical protein